MLNAVDRLIRTAKQVDQVGTVELKAAETNDNVPVSSIAEVADDERQ